MASLFTHHPNNRKFSIPLHQNLEGGQTNFYEDSFMILGLYEMLRNIYEFTKSLRIYEIRTNLRNSYEFLRIPTSRCVLSLRAVTKFYEILRNFYEFTKSLRIYEIFTNLRISYESIRTRDQFYEFPTNLYESHRESNELKSVLVPRKCRK